MSISHSIAVFITFTSSMITVSSCVAEEQDGRQFSSADVTEISCRSMQGPFMDTTVGYQIPIPENFEAISNPPTMLQSFKSGNTGKRALADRTSILIWAEPANSIDKNVWHALDLKHVNSSFLEILQRSYEERGKIIIFEYAILRGENGLFVSSVTPIDLNGLLDCFIPI